MSAVWTRRTVSELQQLPPSGQPEALSDEWQERLSEEEVADEVVIDDDDRLGGGKSTPSPRVWSPW